MMCGPRVRVHTQGRTRASPGIERASEINIRIVDCDGSIGSGSLALCVSNNVFDGHGRTGRIDGDRGASRVQSAIVEDRDIALGVAAVRVGRGRDQHRRVRGGVVDHDRGRGRDGGRARDIDTGGRVRADPVGVCLGSVRV